MKLKLIAFASLAIVCILSTAAKPGKPKDTPEKLKSVLNDFFTSIGTQDFDKLKSTVTSDFILYEDGLVWNIDSAFMNIKRHMPFTVTYTMDNMKFFIDKKSGDVTYTNHGEFVYAAGKRSLDWVESATFRKINGAWKINFLQATVRK